MRTKKIIIGILVVMTALLSGILLGAKSNIVSGSVRASAAGVPADLLGENIDMSEFWDVWRLLEGKHPSGTEVSAQDKIWSATKGLAESMNDPYTIFLPPKQNEQFNTNLSGEFSGVGMEVGIKSNLLTVIAPLKDSPAEKAGVAPGDIIVKIDDKTTTDMTVDQAVDLIRGKAGTSVVITVMRKGEEVAKEISIVRGVIKIPVIETEYREKENVFVIKFYEFGQSSSAEFEKALTEFKNSGSKYLIIDLRNNPGGYLSAAVDIASWFLPEGETVVSERSKDPSLDKVYKSSVHHLQGSYHMVLLVNGGSASASEILAGALQEHGVAKLVGEQTFGKGSVQELVPLPHNTSLKTTIANWYTPNGVSISKQGLKPDYVVPFDTEKFKKDGIDTQLQKALEVVKRK